MHWPLQVYLPSGFIVISTFSINNIVLYTGSGKFMATHILTWFSNKNKKIENLLQQLIAK